MFQYSITLYSHSAFLPLLSLLADQNFQGRRLLICPSNHMSMVRTNPPSAAFRTLTSDNRVIIEKILVLTADGRSLTGTLLSCDQLTNLVLQNTIERVIRPREDTEDSEEVAHGLYLIRGENVAVCGLVNEELDASIDWTKVRGNVIGGVKHQ